WRVNIYCIKRQSMYMVFIVFILCLFMAKFFRKEEKILLFVSGFLAGGVLATFFMASFIVSKTEETRIKNKH
ncbi:TPA: hypothetical protein ACOBGK_002439, partial [Enterococcus faecium]